MSNLQPVDHKYDALTTTLPDYCWLLQPILLAG